MATQVNLSNTNFKEKIRCGEVYRNLNGNEMFQKFYYRCLECSLDFESSPEFEEHVIVHLITQDDDNDTTAHTLNTNENVISISSDEEETADYLYAFEVASLVEENVSENDLPLPLMQMLSEQATENCDRNSKMNSGSDVGEEEEDEEEESNAIFPCHGLRRQALQQYSDFCCTQCPAYFSSKNELTLHLNIHTLPNTVVCPHCYEIFSNVIKLNEHLVLIKKKKIRKTQKCTDSYHNCKRAKNINSTTALIHKGKDNKISIQNEDQNINFHEDQNINSYRLSSEETLLHKQSNYEVKVNKESSIRNNKLIINDI